VILGRERLWGVHPAPQIPFSLRVLGAFELAFVQRLVALVLISLMLGQGSAWAQTAKTTPSPSPSATTQPVATPQTPKANAGGPAAQASGPSFPALTGRVVDQANIIPADVEAQLTAKLAALEASSSDQVVVATVPGLQGYEIEEYGYRLGRAWQIGQGERLNNGVILLVAPNERKVRIEVGYGLEGIITDYHAGLIVRNTIVPAFKAGDMPGGIVAGVNELETLLTMDPAELQARAERGLQAEAAGQGEDDGVSFFVVLFIIVFLWIVISNANRGHPRFRRVRRSGWDGAGMSTHDWRTTQATADIAGNVLGGLISIALSGDGEGGGGGGGGFSGGGGSFGGGGASGSW
jgi:uncharacterized protein